MSHGEGQEWEGTGAAVAAPPPKSGTGTASVLRTVPVPEPLRASASQWEMLYRAVPPNQQADLLSLASQQGLLYGHQLPPPPPSRGLQASDEPRTWNLLGKILAGQFMALDPVRPQPLQITDETLDETQRYAVATALATPDVALIQGLPGTGKSRVVAEIIAQAARRSDRILFLSNHSAALDCVLQRVSGLESLCPIRCIASQESVADLPAPIRALTFQERALSIKQNTVVAAQNTRQAAEMQCARRRYQEPIWPRLEELAQALAEAGAALAQTETRLSGIAAEVAKESEAASGRLAHDLRKLDRSGAEQIAHLEKDSATALAEQEIETAKLADLERKIEVVRPLAMAKEKGQWWKGAWWKARFQADVCGSFRELTEQSQKAHHAVQALAKRLDELAEARKEAAAKTCAARQALLQTEIEARQRKLHALIQQHQAEIDRHGTLWCDLCRQIDPDAASLLVQTVDAVRTAREQWQLYRQEDEARCSFAREWAEYLESSSEAVVARLPGFVNLVAATPAALAVDPHFGDATLAAGQFDLLILEEADNLSEADFLKAARRARRLLLIGQPPVLGETLATISSHSHAVNSTNSSRVHWFHQLWQRLHCDPSTLPYQWFQEGQRLGCRLRSMSLEQRHCLEIEAVADAPDVELRILAMPRSRPVLAEVLFPGTTSVPAAKEFLFRELQEITIQTASRSLRWSLSPQITALHFAVTPEGSSAVTLDHGVREYLTGPDLNRTCKLEFDHEAGWDAAAVEQWIDQHLHLRDLGRTVLLEKPYRMTPPLAGVVFDLLGLGDHECVGAVAEPSEPVVEFIAALGTNKPKPTGRNNGRTGTGTEQAATGLPPTGAGLETDLAAVRQGDRLPAELRSLTAGRGFVNLHEARAVVRKLEGLMQKSPNANGRNGAPAGTVAVVALFACQAELIGQLIAQSPALASHAAAIAVGLPAAFRHGEADIVVVSLTRSHNRRAVAYGEGPAALISALTRARRKLILVGDPGNLFRRSLWRGALDHLDEATGNRESQLIGQLVRYLQGQGRHQQAFRSCEGNLA